MYSSRLWLYLLWLYYTILSVLEQGAILTMALLYDSKCTRAGCGYTFYGSTIYYSKCTRAASNTYYGYTIYYSKCTRAASYTYHGYTYYTIVSVLEQGAAVQPLRCKVRLRPAIVVHLVGVREGEGEGYRVPSVSSTWLG